MRNFNINFRFLLETLWIHFLRGEVWTDYLRLIATELQRVNTAFASNVTATREIYLYSSQKIYLEKRLNDLFDPIDRLIYVEKLTVDRDFTVYQNGEFQLAYTYQISEPDIVYMYQSSDSFLTINYRVHCLASLASVEAQIRGILDLYKQSGTIYELIFDL